MRIAIYAIAAVALLSSPASAEPRAHSGFDAISASGRVEVEILAGPQFSVDVSGPRIERVLTRVEGATLRIETRNERGWGGHGRDARVRVTLPSLRALDVSAGAEVDARDVAAAAFALDASSGANVAIEGECQRLTLDVSSGANVRAGDFRCAHVRAEASSGANATVYAVEAISVDGSSGANVRWMGPANARAIELSSGASARRMNP
jgi:hypothetical protein